MSCNNIWMFNHVCLSHCNDFHIYSIFMAFLWDESLVVEKAIPARKVYVNALIFNSMTHEMLEYITHVTKAHCTLLAIPLLISCMTIWKSHQLALFTSIVMLYSLCEKLNVHGHVVKLLAVKLSIAFSTYWTKVNLCLKHITVLHSFSLSIRLYIVISLIYVYQWYYVESEI